MFSLIALGLLMGFSFAAPPGVVAAETMRRGVARGFHAAVDIHRMDVPERVNPETWEIVCRTKKVFRIEIRYPPSDIRRGH